MKSLPLRFVESFGYFLLAEMIKHIQETHYPNTPIWIEITQHKEVKK